MKVAIIGAGVIGVTSAWYLAAAGHEVVVIERRAGPALETSFANAGEISPGYASPWAAPGIPLKALRWLIAEHPPLIIRPRIDLAMLRWLVAMLGHCTAARYAINKERMVRLAEYSRDQLIELRRITGISYDERSKGTLQLFREERQLNAVAKDIAVLKAHGVPFELLDQEGCTVVEPGLAAAEAAFAGGLRLPNDETGDCYKFTTALAEATQTKGVRYFTGHSVRRLEVEDGRVVRVVTDQGNVAADAYVVAAGSYSPALVRPLGIRLPVYPVKGYSITVPIDAEEHAPVSTLLDESFKVAITRLGSRVRVGGMAEISGFSSDLPDARRRTLEHSLATLFPNAGDPKRGSFWSGLRPMTPDSTPVIGSTAFANLYLNTGHGTLGWTMACGSGHILADLIGGRTPAIETRDLAISRYARRGGSRR